MAGANPTHWIRDARHFASEVRGELRKVTWPTRKETVQGTVGVLVIVAAITLVLSLADYALTELLRFVLPGTG